MTLPLCDTTMTPRLPVTLCVSYERQGICHTYCSNLGPCETWEEGANGRCVYCDHSLMCHPSVLKQAAEETGISRRGVTKAVSSAADQTEEITQW